MVIFGIVILALSTKIDMFAAFTKGAKDGFKVVYEILPTLIGLMLAVGILRTSGILDVVGDILAKPLSVIGFPSQLVPLSLVKMFSSSAATGLLLDIFKKLFCETCIIHITNDDIEICIFGMVQIIDLSAFNHVKLLPELGYISGFGEDNACVISISIFEESREGLGGLLRLNKLTCDEIR